MRTNEPPRSRAARYQRKKRDFHIEASFGVLDPEGNKMWASISRLTLVLIALFVCGGSSGCTQSGAPSCTDETVKKLAIQLSKSKLKNALWKQAVVAKIPNDKQSLLSTIPYDAMKETLNMPGGGDPGSIKFFRDIIESVDRQAEDVNVKLVNIRLNRKDNVIKKCECSGDIGLNDGKTLPINYTAQFTEDGKVYVEVH